MPDVNINTVYECTTGALVLNVGRRSNLDWHSKHKHDAIVGIIAGKTKEQKPSSVCRPSFNYCF